MYSHGLSATSLPVSHLRNSGSVRWVLASGSFGTGPVLHYGPWQWLGLVAEPLAAEQMPGFSGT